MDILNEKVVKKTRKPIKIMQFGEGNFLRAFLDQLIQEMNDKGVYDGHVVVVQPLEMGRVTELKKQDGLYTVILQGLNSEGKEVDYHKVIDVLDDFVNPYTEYDKYLAYAESKDLEIVFSNTTEAGIAFDSRDVTLDLNKQIPFSYPGKLLAFLKRRFEVLKEEYSLCLCPCELLDDNGDKLKAALLKLANERKESAAFINYIENVTHYTSNLVDRIVPGFPRENFNELCEKFNYIDNNMVKGEYFHLFVIKQEEEVMKRFPINKVDSNTLYVADIHPYKQRKVRILNGTHTSLVPVAYLSMHDEVRESLLDEDVMQFVKETVYSEIVPTVKAEGAKDFADAVLLRFLNPFMHHKLMSIALNSISKFKERDLPTLLDNIENGNLPTHLLFSFASLLAFYRGYRYNNGVKEEIKLNDTESNLAFFKDAYLEYDQTKDVKTLVNKFLSNTSFWDKDLSNEKVIVEKVEEYASLILNSTDYKQVLKDFLSK